MKPKLFWSIFSIVILLHWFAQGKSHHLIENKGESTLDLHSFSTDTTSKKYQVTSVSLDSLYITKSVFVYKGMKIRLPKLTKDDHEFDEITWAESYPIKGRPDTIYAKPSFGGKKYRVTEIWSYTFNGKEFWYDIVLKGRDSGVLICDGILSTWNGELKIRGYKSPRMKLVTQRKKKRISQKQFWDEFIKLNEQIPGVLPQ